MANIENDRNLWKYGLVDKNEETFDENRILGV